MLRDNRMDAYLTQLLPQSLHLYMQVMLLSKETGERVRTVSQKNNMIKKGSFTGFNIKMAFDVRNRIKMAICFPQAL